MHGIPIHLGRCARLWRSAFRQGRRFVPQAQLLRRRQAQRNRAFRRPGWGNVVVITANTANHRRICPWGRIARSKSLRIGVSSGRRR
jgi:hypothetical protein